MDISLKHKQEDPGVMKGVLVQVKQSVWQGTPSHDMSASGHGATLTCSVCLLACPSWARGSWLLWVEESGSL